MQVQISQAQQGLDAADLRLVLALARAGTFKGAGARLGIDPSTAFRKLQRLEKALRVSLFVRSRGGCVATELGNLLAQHSERIEAELEAARATSGLLDGPVEGQVRITSTDVLLSRLVVPSLPLINLAHPLLRFDLFASYDLANLSKRDADIAIRVTRTPPEHMIGRSLGVIREAVFVRAPAGKGKVAKVERGLDEHTRWIVLDDAIPNHPSSRWRKQNFPSAQVIAKVNSIQTLFDAVANGIGVGVLPVFMAEGHDDLVQLTDPLDDCTSELWLLTHPESRHLRRVATVFKYLAEKLSMS